jgi:hypothetical protein
MEYLLAWNHEELAFTILWESDKLREMSLVEGFVASNGLRIAKCEMPELDLCFNACEQCDCEYHEGHSEDCEYDGETFPLILDESSIYIRGTNKEYWRYTETRHMPNCSPKEVAIQIRTALREFDAFVESGAVLSGRNTIME